jgi:hypothetical protein
MSINLVVQSRIHQAMLALGALISLASVGGVVPYDEVWLVEFMVPWCPYCQAFTPIFEAMTTGMPSSQTVNCDEFNCLTYGVESYPTIAIVEHGAISRSYNGDLTAEAFGAWLEEVTEEAPSSHQDIPTQAPPETPKEHVLPPSIEDVVYGTAKFLADDIWTAADVMSQKDAEDLLTWLSVLERLPGDAGSSFGMARTHLQKIRTITREKWAVAYDAPVITHDESACDGSYTCSLWIALHASIELAETDEEAFEVLRAVTSLISGHFGCETCREHFKAMVSGNVAGIAPWHFAEGKSGARLWLWAAHNLVSTRLQKQPYPSGEECTHCFIGGPHVSPYLVKMYSFKFASKEKTNHARGWLVVLWVAMAMACALAFYSYRTRVKPTEPMGETLVEPEGEEAAYLEVNQT